MTLFTWQSDTTTTFGVVLGILTAIFFLPLMIYSLREYYGYRNNVMLKKRYSNLTIIQVVLCGLLDLGLSIFELSIVGVFSNNTKVNLLITAVSAMISLLCSAGVANLLLFRDWLIIFDNNFAMATRKRIEWQVLIDPNHVNNNRVNSLNHNNKSNVKENNNNKESIAGTNSPNWWLIHKNDFGNYYFVRKIVLVKIIIECIIIAVPWCYVLSQKY